MLIFESNVMLSAAENECPGSWKDPFHGKASSMGKASNTTENMKSKKLRKLKSKTTELDLV